MGTKVQGKNYLPGYHSMRDLNEDSNTSCNWPLYYEDKSLSNGQYCNGFFPTPTTDSHSGNDKDSVKQTMLEHEATFKNQVNELHRLYRIQRDMMDGTKSKEHDNNLNRIPVGASWPPSPLASPITSEDPRKWTNHRGFSMPNSVHDRPSTSGVDAIHSPYSSQNGSSLKEVEVLESRPTKVQRKLFGLRLPGGDDADMDEGERVSNGKITAISGYSYPRGCETTVHKNGFKFGGEDNARKAEDCRGGTLSSDPLLRSPNGLVDLNEPCRLDDANEDIASSYEFCTGRIYDSARFCKPKEISVDSYGSDIDTRSKIISHKIENGRGWLSHMPEVERGKSTVQSLPRFLRTDLPHSTQQAQVSSSNVDERTFHRSDKIKGRLRKDEAVFGTELSRRTLDLNSSRNLGPITSPNVSGGPYQVSSPSWLHSWEKPSSSFNQKPRSVNGSLASAPSDGILGDRWNLNRNSNSNPAFLGGERMRRNGFHHQGSLLGTKEQPIQIPSSSVERTLRRSGMKPPKDMNLNEAVSDSSSDTEMHVSEAKVSATEKKHEDRIAVPSWLRPKPGCEDAVVGLRSVSKTSETGIFQPCNQRSVESGQSILSSNGFQASEVEPSDCTATRKLLGFPIFEKPNDDSKNDSSSCVSGADKPKKMVFDMNLPIDPATPDLFNLNEESLVVEIETTQAESAGLRHHIDLNVCLSSDNDDNDPSSKPSCQVSRETGIDLEALPSPSAEEEIEASPTSPETEELITAAAETIVTIAALEPPPEKNPLAWFVEIACHDDLDDDKDDDDASEESDYFESAILQLLETKEEDYMPPPPPVPSAGNDVVTREAGPGRPRKGQGGKRGRKKRDFQRDILPSLVSLSRHEVTEDLQALMQAAGHTWRTGPTRRSFGRGRRRVVVEAAVSPPPLPPPTSVPEVMIDVGAEVAGTEEDRSSLAGWGKTTRRPRRQRCPAGNPTPLLSN